jgi:hypothetical protein
MPTTELEGRNVYDDGGYQQSLYLDNNSESADQKTLNAMSNNDFDVASQGLSYSDYQQDDKSGLDELLLRRRLALQRALRRRNGVAGSMKKFPNSAEVLKGSSSLAGNDLNDLTGAGAYLDSNLLSTLKNRDSDILGLGSSGYGDDFGYSPYSGDLGGYGHQSCQQNGLNPLLLILTLALAGAGYYIMYTRLTAIAGKRKKRDDESDGFLYSLYDSVFAGGFSDVTNLAFKTVFLSASAIFNFLTKNEWL